MDDEYKQILAPHPALKPPLLPKSPVYHAFVFFAVDSSLTPTKVQYGHLLMS